LHLLIQLITAQPYAKTSEKVEAEEPHYYVFVHMLILRSALCRDVIGHLLQKL